MSEFARRIFQKQHADSPDLDDLMSKVTMRPPNLVIPDMTDWFDPGESMDELRLLFVGGHFARKGGLAIVKMAEKALKVGAPVHVTIVSSLDAGGGIWTDPTREAFYEPYFKLLDLPNVTLLRGAPNEEVLKIARRSHMSLLPTFGDTFGYSALEGMVNFTPVIGTRQGALPEFINGANGVLLDLPLSDIGEWIHIARPDRDTDAYEKLFADESERLASEMLEACIELIDDRQRLASMRKSARDTVVARFGADDATRFWDDFYVKTVDDVIATRGAAGALQLS